MNHIREIRERKKMTQKELAELAGVSRTTIVNIESGVTPSESITFGTISAISEALGAPVSEILGVNDDARVIKENTVKTVADSLGVDLSNFSAQNVQSSKHEEEKNEE